MSLPLLETVYRIASLDLSTEQRSAQLTIALREHTTDADAKTRVKKGGLADLDQPATTRRWR